MHVCHRSRNKFSSFFSIQSNVAYVLPQRYLDSNSHDHHFKFGFCFNTTHMQRTDGHGYDYYLDTSTRSVTCAVNTRYPECTDTIVRLIELHGCEDLVPKLTFFSFSSLHNTDNDIRYARYWQCYHI